MKAWVIAGVIAVAAAGASPAGAKDWHVAMVNHGANGAMDFSPAFVHIAPGDTVRFIAQDKSHNAESILELTPPGGTTFKGAMNSDVAVKFTRPGLYGYKCSPHFPMGMVGLVEVGKPVNVAAFRGAAAKLPPVASQRMAKFLQQVK